MDRKEEKGGDGSPAEPRSAIDRQSWEPKAADWTLADQPEALPAALFLFLPQGIVAHQDSLLAFQAPEAVERQRERLSRSNSCKEAPPADQQSTELALLQKQHALLQQELSRCRQLGQEKAQEVAVLEARLRESEGERQRLEREADEARRQLAAPRVPLEAVWVRKGTEPRRRSLPAGDALYQSFTPPPVSASGWAPRASSCPRDWCVGGLLAVSFSAPPGVSKG